jgi:hypothetical protein
MRDLYPIHQRPHWSERVGWSQIVFLSAAAITLATNDKNHSNEGFAFSLVGLQFQFSQAQFLKLAWEGKSATLTDTFVQ